MTFDKLVSCNTVVFYDEHYPQICTDATLSRLVPGSFQTVGAAELAEQLNMIVLC